MAAQKIASDVASANAGVSKISKVSIPKGREVTIGKSNIQAMKTGSTLSNRLLSDLESLVKSVQTQANKFPQLAEVIAQRDSNQKFNAGGK